MPLPFSPPPSCKKLRLQLRSLVELTHLHESSRLSCHTSSARLRSRGLDPVSWRSSQPTASFVLIGPAPWPHTTGLLQTGNTSLISSLSCAFSWMGFWTTRGVGWKVCFISVVVAQWLSPVWLFATPRTAARQASCPSLSGFVQTHVHWVSDAIQPFHPLSCFTSNYYLLFSLLWQVYFSQH